jgi:hypothetical protein
MSQLPESLAVEAATTVFGHKDQMDVCWNHVAIASLPASLVAR